MPELHIIELTKNRGLGFGNENGISRTNRESLSGNEDLAEITDEAIRSPQILTTVNEGVNDDGCGDGRNLTSRAGSIFTKGKEFGKSLIRPKIFGGGATMTLAARVGMGLAKSKTLEDNFHESIAQLNSNGVDFGAHIDNHAKSPNCGCGAIDKAPQIIAATSKYQEQIAETIAGLGIDTDDLGEVLSAFSDYADVIKDETYSGRKVMTEIVENNKIIKELADDHKETRIVLNTVKGYTVDQEFFRQATDGRSQVFAVDEWRMQEISEKLWKTSLERHKAFLSMLTYTLATAAVLTRGDLPVYVVRPADEAALVSFLS